MDYKPGNCSVVNVYLFHQELWHSRNHCCPLCFHSRLSCRSCFLLRYHFPLRCRFLLHCHFLLCCRFLRRYLDDYSTWVSVARGYTVSFCATKKFLYRYDISDSSRYALNLDVSVTCTANLIRRTTTEV